MPKTDGAHRPSPSTLFPFPPLLHPAKDATEDFDEIGHSNAAKEQLAKYYIGEYEVGRKGGGGERRTGGRGRTRRRTARLDSPRTSLPPKPTSLPLPLPFPHLQGGDAAPKKAASAAVRAKADATAAGGGAAATLLKLLLPLVALALAFAVPKLLSQG